MATKMDTAKALFHARHANSLLVQKGEELYFKNLGLLREMSELRAEVARLTDIICMNEICVKCGCQPCLCPKAATITVGCEPHG